MPQQYERARPLIGSHVPASGKAGELLRHPLLAGVPFVVETPGDRDTHVRDIATLKALRDAD